MILVKTLQTDLIDLNAELYLNEKGFLHSVKWDSIKIGDNIFRLQTYSHNKKSFVLAYSYETPLELRIYVAENKFEETLLSNERVEDMINGKHFELTEWEQGMLDFQKELAKYS